MALIAEPKKVFRITYRMEVYIKANTEAEAIEKFEEVSFETLAQESTFVERVSVDEETE
jgi:hypothetical protein